MFHIFFSIIALYFGEKYIKENKSLTKAGIFFCNIFAIKLFLQIYRIIFIFGNNFNSSINETVQEGRVLGGSFSIGIYCLEYFYFILLIMANHNLFGEGDRYILPILPLVFFYFFSALKRVFKFFPNKVGVCLFCVIFMVNVKAASFKRPSINEAGSVDKNFIFFHNWMDENISDEGIIFSRKPTVTFFFTKNKSIVYPFTLNSDKIWRTIRRNDIKYIVLDEFSLQTFLYLRPFVGKYKDEFKILKTIGNTHILEVGKDRY